MPTRPHSHTQPCCDRAFSIEFSTLRLRMFSRIGMCRILWIAVFVAGMVHVSAAQPQDTLSWSADVAPEDEPGELLVVTGTLYGPDGTPLAGTPVHVFQADAEGYYAKGPDGDDLGWRQARISGWLRTRDDGTYRVRTIRPGGYPNRRTPAHIHFRLSTNGQEEQELTLFFEDDPRLTPQIRSELSGSGYTFFRPVERDSTGTWRCMNDMRLPP